MKKYFITLVVILLLSFIDLLFPVEKKWLVNSSEFKSEIVRSEADFKIDRVYKTEIQISIPQNGITGMFWNENYSHACKVSKEGLFLDIVL